MATQALDVPDRTLSIGRVFERTFATFRHNPVVTLGIGLAFGALPSLGTEFVSVRLDTTASIDPSVWSPILQSLIMFALFSLVNSLSQAVFTPPMVAEAEDRRAQLGESVLAVARSLIPLILLTAFSVIMMSIGLVILLIPGLILWVMWIVAVPALIMERKGAFKALYRSAELTDGARWTIFGLLLVVSAVSIGTTLAIEAMTGGLESESSLLGLEDPLYLSLTLVNDTLMTLLYAGVVASLYVELRDWKDGPAAGSLEDILS